MYWSGTFPIERVSSKFLLLQCFIEIPVFNANSVDPDQTLHSVGLIWVYTICQCPFYRMLGINGLTHYHTHPKLGHMGTPVSLKK